MKKLLLPLAAALLASGAFAQVNTSVDVTTNGVSANGVFFEVNAPASLNFVFDFTQPGSSNPTDLVKANWAAFQNIVASNAPAYLDATNQSSYGISVASNANYQVVLGVPTASGTGFSLDRYHVQLSWPGSTGITTQGKLLNQITAPWTVRTAGPGNISYTLMVRVYVKPSDVPSGYNQNITIPLTLIPTP